MIQVSRYIFFLLAGCGMLTPISAASETTTPASRDVDWWQQRHAAMNRAATEREHQLVFIGDSITQSWEGPGKEVWQKFYENRDAGNLGISGDETQHVLYRLANGNLEGQSPRLAVIHDRHQQLGQRQARAR